jgi:hypothetical protein
MSHRLAILLSVLMVSPALGQDETSANGINVGDVVQKNGVILSFKYLNKGKVRMKFQSDETQEFTLNWKTLIYKLTDRNRKIYTEQDKLEDIVKDVNKLNKRIKEIPDHEIELIAHSWTDIWTSGVYQAGNRLWRDVYVYNHINRNAVEKLSKAQLNYWRDEEERHNIYGPPVTLVPQMTALVVADKGRDVTYAVLVTGRKEPPKKEKDNVVDSPGQDRDAEAGRKLKYAKQMLSDAKAANGDEKDRLTNLANKKLQELVDKYEGSKAAKEAQELLDKK